MGNTDERKAPKNIAWDDIAALLAKDWEPRDIAMKFGCSVQNIYARIQRHRAKAGR